MIGPGASKVASGGIVTVINNLKSSFNENDMVIEHIVTMQPASKLKRIVLYFNAIFLVLLNLFSSGKKIAHIHVSARTSFYRKSTFVMLLRLFRVPVIIHLHSGEFDIFYEKELCPLMKKYVKWIYSLADRVILLTDGWDKWFIDTINTGNSIVLYNGVSNYYDTTSVPLDKRDNIILFLGRLSEKKGIYDLLYALKDVLKDCPDAILKVCGDGELDKCKLLAKELNIDQNINFLGWVNEEEKFNLLNQSKVYILPSYFEALPMSILEAMSAGIGIIATKVGGIPEIVIQDKNGLLIENAANNTIYKSIIYLLNNPSNLVRLGDNAKDSFSKNFDINTIVAQLKKIYSDVLNSKKGIRFESDDTQEKDHIFTL